MKLNQRLYNSVTWGLLQNEPGKQKSEQENSWQWAKWHRPTPGLRHPSVKTFSFFLRNVDPRFQETDSAVRLHRKRIKGLFALVKVIKAG